jgi:hypothetical protein
VWLVPDANRDAVIFPFRVGFTIIKKGLTITSLAERDIGLIGLYRFVLPG